MFVQDSRNSFERCTPFHWLIRYTICSVGLELRGKLPAALVNGFTYLPRLSQFILEHIRIAIRRQFDPTRSLKGSSLYYSDRLLQRSGITRHL
jgi:hypothetical protein